MNQNLIYVAYIGFLAAAVFFKYKEYILSRFWPESWRREFMIKNSGDLLVTWERAAKKHIYNKGTYFLQKSRSFRSMGVAAWMHNEDCSLPVNVRAAYEPANDPRTVNAIENIDYNQWHEKKSMLDGFNYYYIIALIIIAVIGYYAWQWYQGTLVK